MSNKPVSLSDTPPSMSENSAVAILQALIILLAVFTVLDLNAAQKRAFLDKRDGPTPSQSMSGAKTYSTFKAIHPKIMNQEKI